jgi:Na+/H+-dicarboxylate symporter
MRLKHHNQIFIGMVLGVVIGMTLWWYAESAATSGRELSGVYHTVMWALDLLGPTLFIGALKMIIAPLILASIVAGVTSLPNMKELGSIGWKTLAYYFVTTTIAVIIGLVTVLTLRPGHRDASLRIRADAESKQELLRAQYQGEFGESAVDANGEPRPRYVVWLHGQKRREAGAAAGSFESQLEAISRAEDRTPGEIFTNDIVRPLLMNPFRSLAANPPNALGIIFFSLLMGIACTVVGSPAQPVVRFFQGLNGVMMTITHWLVRISPVAIGCIVAKLVADTGPKVFASLGWYCAAVIGGIFVHVIVLLAISTFLGGVNPIALWSGIREAWMIALSTRSSAATLPVTIANVTENLKVSPKVANFSLPLGATMNMDGTALYEGVAVIFLIQIYGGLDDVLITMTAVTTFLIFITAVLASIGAAAVPDAGLVTMVIVASAVNLPIYYIPLIFAVDAVLDMFRTSTNVLGDSIGAVVVHRLEKHRLGDELAA